MNKSDQINELVSALVKAQAEFLPIKKASDNPFYHSKYADLPTLIAATQPALSKYGLAVMQSVSSNLAESTVSVETMLAHTSGQWISGELHLPAMQKDRVDAQTVGSGTSYGRRYGLQAILNVAGDVDDDGNAASGVGSKEAAQSVAQQKIAKLEKSQEGKPNHAPVTGADLTPALKKSLDAISAAKGLEPKENPFKANPHPLEGATAPDLRPLIVKAEMGKKGGKGEGVMFIEYDSEKVAVFDKKLHQFIKAGMKADLEIRGNTVNGKKYVNLVRAYSIGDVEFDEEHRPKMRVEVANEFPKGNALEPDWSTL